MVFVFQVVNILAIAHLTLGFPSLAASNSTAVALNQSNSLLTQFERLITNRVAEFIPTWPDVSVVSVALASDDDITNPDTAFLHISLFAPGIRNYLDMKSMVGSDPPHWSPTMTRPLPPGEPLPDRFVWGERHAVSLRGALSLLSSQGYEGPWVAATLERTDDTLLPVPGGLLWVFEREAGVFSPYYGIIEMAAATGDIVGKFRRRGDTNGGSNQGTSNATNLEEKPASSFGVDNSQSR